MKTRLFNKKINILNQFNMNKKNINFDKIIDLNSYYYNYQLMIEIEIKKGILSINGAIFNDDEIIMMGSISKYIIDMYPNNPKIKKIYKIWVKYHSNDNKPYSDTQYKYLKKNNLLNLKYDETCKILKSVDLYIDKNFNNYRYGSKNLKINIPFKVYRDILQL